MRIDGALSMQVGRAAGQAADFEAMGLDGAWSFEADHDPFIPLTLAATTTERIELGTAISVAFARTPMTLAHTAWDLQRLTGGRFVLGLGTQIRPHITKRYAMPWSAPAARMRDYVEALRAIWHSWSTGDRLDHRGDFYQHTLMPPAFSPGPIDHAPPKIYVAGVGPRMVEVIGAVADGFFVHPFHTPDFLAAETLPTLRAGAEAAGRHPDEVDVACLTIVAMGESDEQLDAARRDARAQLAFYGSTPAYAGALELHGFDGLQPELNAMSKEGRWAEMTDRVPDDLLELVAVTGSPVEVGRKLAERNTFADRSTMMFYGPRPTDAQIAEAVNAARG